MRFLTREEGKFDFSVTVLLNFSTSRDLRSSFMSLAGIAIFALPIVLVARAQGGVGAAAVQLAISVIRPWSAFSENTEAVSPRSAIEYT